MAGSRQESGEAAFCAPAKYRQRPGKRWAVKALTRSEWREWIAAAHAARYQIRRLARGAKVSPRQLRRYFQSRGCARPKNTLDVLRAQYARQALRLGFSAKEVMRGFYFYDAAHLCRALKQHCGAPPKKFARARMLSPKGRPSNDPFSVVNLDGRFIQRCGAFIPRKRLGGMRGKV